MRSITSLQNPRVKNAVRLRDARHRQKQGRMLIDGARELLRAVDAGVEFEELFVFEPACRRDDVQTVLDHVDDAAIPVWSVTEPVFQKLAFGHRSEGFVAVARIPQRRLADVPLPEVPLLAVLDGVEKPGNVGAVLRSADGAGVDAVIVADGGTDLYNPNAIRASLGTIFRVSVCEAPAEETLVWLEQRKLQVVAARVDGSVPYTEVDYRRPTALVLGSEAQGLDPRWHDAAVVGVRLPMLGIADSLNVSAAAAVLFYEARRQRGA